MSQPSCGKTTLIHAPHHHVVAQPSGRSPGMTVWCEGVTSEQAAEAEARANFQLEGFTVQEIDNA